MFKEKRRKISCSLKKEEKYNVQRKKKKNIMFN